jgi:hypothetical protein
MERHGIRATDMTIKQVSMREMLNRRAERRWNVTFT